MTKLEAIRKIVDARIIPNERRIEGIEEILNNPESRTDIIAEVYSKTAQEYFEERRSGKRTKPILLSP